LGSKRSARSPININPVDSPIHPDGKTWEGVRKIEEEDLVFRLLQRIRTDVSYADLCKRLGESLGLDGQGLRETGFLNADDSRLKRLTNGNFALEEWFIDDSSGPTELASETESKLDTPLGSEPGPESISMLLDEVRIPTNSIISPPVNSNILAEGLCPRFNDTQQFVVAPEFISVESLPPGNVVDESYVEKVRPSDQPSRPKRLRRVLSWLIRMVFRRTQE